MTGKNYSATSGEKKLLDALPGAAAILDCNGTIVVSNKKWEKEEEKCHNWLYTASGGANFFTHCEKMVTEGNDYALRLIFNLRDVLDGNKLSTELTIALNGENKQWCKASITALSSSKPAALLMFSDETTSMNAIKALRDSEEKYSYQFEHSVSGIIIGSICGKVLDANPAACNILGYTKDELIEGGRSLIVDESDPNHIEMIQIRQEDGFFEGEKEYFHKDGRRIPVAITSVVYRNGDGDLNIINTFRDKSVEKNTQYSLDEERRFSQTALNSIPGIFIVIDSKLNIIRWNSVLYDELGFSPSELAEMNGIDLFSKEDRKWVQNVLKKILETGSGNFVAKILSKNGDTRSFHFYFNKFKSDKDLFLVATAVDKTDYLKAEIQREKNFELMSQLFENSPLAMVMISPNGEIQQVNDGFLKLFGYNKTEVLNRNVNKLITSEKNWHQAESVNKQAFEGKSDQQETTRITKDRQQIPVLVNTVPIHYDHKVIAVYGIYVDLREQKRLEKHLQKNIDEKDILLQEVHHRVKNNLAIIAGLIDLQIIHECDQTVIKKLQEVHSRIFSIAKIHETLYQQKNVVMIDFNHYLQSMFNSQKKSGTTKNVPKLTIEGEENLILNLNQAVPLGLALNELLHTSEFDIHSNEITIKLEKSSHSISVVVKGLPDTEKINSNSDSQDFKKLLLQIFLKQINATMNPSKNGDKYIVINFEKDDDMKGSSNALFKQTYSDKHE